MSQRPGRYWRTTLLTRVNGLPTDVPNVVDAGWNAATNPGGALPRPDELDVLRRQFMVDGLDADTAALWVQALCGEVDDLPPCPLVPCLRRAIGQRRRRNVNIVPVLRSFAEAVFPRPGAVDTWDEFVRTADANAPVTRAERHFMLPMAERAVLLTPPALREKRRERLVREWRAAEMWKLMLLTLEGEHHDRLPHHEDMVARLLTGSGVSAPMQALLDRADGRGLLLVSAHTTFIRPMVFLLGARGVAFHLVAGGRLNTSKDRNAQLLLALHALKKGKTVLMSPDGAMGRVEGSRTILNQTFAFSTSFAMMAERTGCHVALVRTGAQGPRGTLRARGVQVDAEVLPAGREAAFYVDAYGRAIARGIVTRPFDYGRVALRPRPRPLRAARPSVRDKSPRLAAAAAVA